MVKEDIYWQVIQVIIGSPFYNLLALRWPSTLSTFLQLKDGLIICHDYIWHCWSHNLRIPQPIEDLLPPTTSWGRPSHPMGGQDLLFMPFLGDWDRGTLHFKHPIYYGIHERYPFFIKIQLGPLLPSFPFQIKDVWLYISKMWSPLDDIPYKPYLGLVPLGLSLLFSILCWILEVLSTMEISDTRGRDVEDFRPVRQCILFHSLRRCPICTLLSHRL